MLIRFSMPTTLSIPRAFEKAEVTSQCQGQL